MEAEALMQELSQSGYDLATEESLLQLTIGATLGVESMPSDDKRYKAAEFRKKFVERMVGWAQTDADAATNWWRQLPANPRRLLLAGGLVEGMSANNPGSAMTMFRDEFLPTEKAVAARGIGTAILQDSGVDNSVSAWRDFVIGENGPPSMDYESRVAYAVVTDMLLNAVQSVDHDDMLRINELASVGIIDAGSLATLGKRLASVDPILALDEMAQFTAIAGQQYMPPAGLEATAKAVAEAQPAELANWLKLNNEFPGRERIVAVLVEGLGSIDPASAADWSQELPRVVELPDEILQQQ